MKKLWQKNWTLNPAVELFETQSDMIFDGYLLPYDCLASYAHAQMLTGIGILTPKELVRIRLSLMQILELSHQGQFALVAGDEDIHTKIENYLTDHHGAVGKKIHTGRSRNDQVLTALRLFTKHQLLLVWKEALKTIHRFIEFAQKYEFEPMPGYTHMQKAMPSSFGMWGGAMAEALTDNITLLLAAYAVNDQCPLGSGAGYGVPIPLNRQQTSELLGFGKVQNNSLYCQNSRVKIESIILGALSAILSDINKFASDVLLFTTEEFGFFQVSPSICTGSSIMPQKVNVDIAELLRSKAHVVVGNYIQLMGIASNLPSGYNRDFQDTKKPLMESLSLTIQSLQMAQLIVAQIYPHPKNVNARMNPSIFATHHAYMNMATGKTFRDAYNQTADALRSKSISIPQKFLYQSRHIGGTGNLSLDKLAETLQLISAHQMTEQYNFETHMHTLLPAWDSKPKPKKYHQ